jgi:hypothetical protein
MIETFETSTILATTFIGVHRVAMAESELISPTISLSLKYFGHSLGIYQLIKYMN